MGKSEKAEKLSYSGRNLGKMAGKVQPVCFQLKSQRKSLAYIAMNSRNRPFNDSAMIGRGPKSEFSNISGEEFGPVLSDRIVHQEFSPFGSKELRNLHQENKRVGKAIRQPMESVAFDDPFPAGGFMGYGPPGLPTGTCPEGRPASPF
jgi:hypothetical protein